MIYTGIGSRETPSEVLTQMRLFAEVYAKANYTLRSGGADGADKAFEEGSDRFKGNKEIFIPWPGFNGNPSPYHTICSDSMRIAEEFHPAWGRLTVGAKKLMARNVYQVLGEDLRTPTDFIVCWTPAGQGGGGTGQAIRIATHYNIDVYDLGNYFHRIPLSKRINGLYAGKSGDIANAILRG